MNPKPIRLSLQQSRLRKFILIPAAAVLTFSCGGHHPATATATAATPGAQAAVRTAPMDRRADSTAGTEDSTARELGTYTGHYSKGMLVLVLNYFSNNIASGYDLHKGLRRNLNGKGEEQDSGLVLELHEPGHNPADGIFYLTLHHTQDKITGKWVPNDPKTAQGGPVELTRVDGPWHGDDYGEAYDGDLGTLTLLGNGTCRLEYYPKTDSGANGQLITIRGNYEQNADTVRIEWQYNTHLPMMKMKLLSRPYTERNDSIPAKPASLQGDGLLFQQSLAG